MKGYYRRSTIYLKINATIILLLVCQTLFAQTDCQLSASLSCYQVSDNVQMACNPWGLERINPRPSVFPHYQYESSNLFMLLSNSYNNCVVRLPLFKNKIFCFNLNSITSCTFSAYGLAGCCSSGSGSGSGQLDIIYTNSIPTVKCSQQGDYNFNITNEKIGTTTYVNSIVKRTGGGASEFVWYNMFSIKVVNSPKWNENMQSTFCKGDTIWLDNNTNNPDSGIKYYYGLLENGATTTLPTTLVSTEIQGKGRYIEAKDLQAGSYLLFIKRQYDNGAYQQISGRITINPAPPTIDANKIKITKACYGEKNAKIELPAEGIISSFSSFHWKLKAGDAPIQCSSNCLSQEDGSATSDVTISGGITTTQSFGAGLYTLQLFNTASNGNCGSRELVTVEQLPELHIVNPPTVQNITCRGRNTGAITGSASGGNVSLLYTYTLRKNDGSVLYDNVRSKTYDDVRSATWTGLFASDQYIIDVKAKGCTTQKPSPSIELTQPDAVTATPTHTNPTCSSPPNGTIQVSIANAASYTYDLLKDNVPISKPGTTTVVSHTFNSLEAGSYVVKIMNPLVSGCVLKTLPVITLAAPTPLGLRVDSNPIISCFGASTGRLKLTGSGGTGSYTYILNNHILPKNTTGIFTGLSAGAYTVTLKNSDTTCTDSFTPTVPDTVRQNPKLTVTLAKQNITCHGYKNGTLTATVRGGSKAPNNQGSYNYSWERYHGKNPAGDSIWIKIREGTRGLISGLTDSTYHLIITDIPVVTDICRASSPAVTFIDPPQLQIQRTVPKDAVCQADGAHIEVTARGGYGNYVYSYSLNDGETYTDFTRETGLATGYYKIKVRDTEIAGQGVIAGQEECRATNDTIYHITVPDVPLDFTVALSQAQTENYHISCHGEDTGTITATATVNSGNGTRGNGTTYVGYQYKINNSQYQDDNTFSGRPAGNYSISVKDARGCEVTKTVTLRQPPVLAYTGSKTNINCFGNSTGTLTPNITGGVPSYTVTVNSIARTVNNPITGLGKGSYQIHVVDAHNCTADVTVSIDYKHEALQATAEKKDIKCSGEKGQATITPTGGDGRYTIRMSSNNWATQEIGTTINELEAGTYHFKVEDGLGCSVAVPQSVVITSPPSPLSFTYTLSDYNGFNISCKGGNNGYATLTASGGNGGSYSDYTFALDNRAYASNPRLNDINVGAHILKVKDARLCEVTDTVRFTESEVILSIQLVSKEDVPCANSSSGTLTVLGSGGAGASTLFEYSLDNKLWQSSPTFLNRTVAVYTVWVKDINACKNSINVEILSSNPAIVIDQLHSQDIVCLHDKANIRVEAHGGTRMLTPQYSRNGGEYISFTQTTPFEEGDYTVRVKDEVACFSSVSAVIHFTSPQEALAFSTVKSNYHEMSISCHGLSNGSLRIDARGGNGGTYNGYTYSLNEGNFGSTDHFTTLASGTYSVRVKDARGCISTQSHELKQPDALSFDIKSMINPKCGAEATGQIVLQAAQGGIPSYQYSLDGVTWQPNTAFERLLKGHYTFYVKDVNECTSQKTTLLESQYPPIVITASITHVNCFGQLTGAIHAVVSGGHGNFTCRWNNEPAQATIQNLPAGNYQLQATDDSGCLGTFNAAISQPPALTLQLQSSPICDGHTNGKITATAAGGVTPYLFSLNDKAGQEAHVFNNLTHETYTVKVADAHACTTTVPATIGKLNVKPDVNFLAATRKHALDTLAIKEISLPVPDSVNWVFDPRLEFIGYEDKSPLIKCKTAGTYWVEMTGKWNSCHYVVKKEITIQPYDPLAGPGKRLPVKVIGEVSLSPNPTHGNLHLSVKLNRKQQLTVFIYSMSAHLIERRQYAPGLSLEDDFTFSSDVSSGTYILRVIAENDSRDMKFILSR